ncbi:MAG: glycosyltransferase family 4 protein [Anaerolineae bacterium]|nr:glycosyltransferase family 4 protein [Anaerolineae bacterium]
MTAESLHVGLLTSDLNLQHGWARYSLEMANALRRAGVDVTLITARNSPPLPGVEIHPILPSLNPMDRGLLPRQFSALPRVRALFQDCDLIHAMVEPYAPLAVRVPGGRPVFVTAHGSYVRANRMRQPPASWVYAAAFQRAELVCVSYYTEKVAQATLSPVSTRVIGNGVDAETFSQVYHVGGGSTPTVLFVGAVKARKGVLELVRAAAKVRERVPGVCFRIVGALDAEPDYADQVRRAADELKLGGVVEFAGRISDDALLKAYAHADIFALPSVNIGWKFEGFGLALLEASAAGLPVIGSRDCGAEDAVVEGETGLLVAQTHLERDLADAILRLLSDPVAAARMGAAGRAFAAAHTWDRAAAALIGAYREALRR